MTFLHLANGVNVSGISWHGLWHCGVCGRQQRPNRYHSDEKTDCKRNFNVNVQLQQLIIDSRCEHVTKTIETRRMGHVED